MKVALSLIIIYLAFFLIEKMMESELPFWFTFSTAFILFIAMILGVGIIWTI